MAMYASSSVSSVADLIVNSTPAPPGSTAGQRWLTSPAARSTVVSARAVPPAAGIVQSASEKVGV